MKKYIFKTVLSFVLALPLMTACEMDQFPDGTIPSEEAWQNMSDVENFYIGLKAALRGDVGGSRAYVSEVQADLFNAKVGTASLNRVHEWSFSTGQFDGDGMWSGNYGLISVANNIINNIDKVEVSDDEDIARINEIKGASYFCRAFAYSCMVPRYCKNYDSATASTDLGLPLVTEVDVNGRPSRASLQATYDFILQDIAQAEELLSDEAGRDEPNKAALTALKARVYLNMKRYDDAIAAATSLFEDYPLAEPEDYAMMWEEDEGTEIILQPLMTPDERSGSFSTVFMSFDTANGSEADPVWQPYFLPTPGLMSLYSPDDVRNCFFLDTKVSALGNVVEGKIFHKYPGNPALRKSTETEQDTWYNMIKVFRTSEMYLIAAEASLFKETPDEAAALNYLNTLREKRNATPLQSTGASLVRDMKEEWVREMVGEGFRLDCLKRWGEGIARKAPQNFPDGILISNPAEQYQGLNIQPGDPLYYKIIWELPSNDTQANSNLQHNWN